MNERTGGAAYDGTVWVGAPGRVDAVFILTFAVKVGRENGVFESGVGVFVVCIYEGGEILEGLVCAGLGRDEFGGDLVGLECHPVILVSFFVCFLF